MNLTFKGIFRIRQTRNFRFLFKSTQTRGREENQSEVIPVYRRSSEGSDNVVSHSRPACVSRSIWLIKSIGVSCTLDEPRSIDRSMKSFYRMLIGVMRLRFFNFAVTPWEMIFNFLDFSKARERLISCLKDFMK